MVMASLKNIIQEEGAYKYMSATRDGSHGPAHLPPRSPPPRDNHIPSVSHNTAFLYPSLYPSLQCTPAHAGTPQHSQAGCAVHHRVVIHGSPHPLVPGQTKGHSRINSRSNAMPISSDSELSPPRK
ncbi:hypothetical protein ABZP36_035343 [Zizania latifolia]